RNAFNNRRHPQLAGTLRVVRNDSQDQTYRASLLKDVGAESADAGHAIGNVDLRNFLEPLFLAVGHYRKSPVQGVFGSQFGGVDDGVQFSTNAHYGKCVYL